MRVSEIQRHVNILSGSFNTEYSYSEKGVFALFSIAANAINANVIAQSSIEQA